MLLPAQFLTLLLAAGVPQEAAQDEAGPLDAAFQAFQEAPKETQKAVIAEIIERVEASDDASLKQLLELRDQAREELKVVPRPSPKYYDPEVWAPGLYRRRFADPEDSGTSMVTGMYRPWESKPPFMARIEYDFGDDVGLDSGVDPSLQDALWDLLYGYPPGADVLVAYLAMKWDFDEGMDPYARHFSHLYCDLSGNAYREVTLYDALASGESMDMPDVDVIPYARLILKDKSFKSPIPPNARRERLYEKIKNGFLEFFRHRTWIEAAANLYVNPEAEIRPEHEPLRKRLLYAFALDGGDLDKIRSRFVKAKERRDFIRQVDGLAINDRREDEKRLEFVTRINNARWAIARICYAVLREYGLLKD